MTERLELLATRGPDQNELKIGERECCERFEQ